MKNLISGGPIGSAAQILMPRACPWSWLKQRFSAAKKSPENMDFLGTIDQKQFAQNLGLLLGGILLSAGLIWGVNQTKFLRTWFNRNILLADDQWPQATYLENCGRERWSVGFYLEELIIDYWSRSPKKSRRKDVNGVARNR